MDILIKNMEMPKRCTGCFNSKCLLFFEHTDPNNSRHPNCPLVALPEHGRLISDTDVKALLRSGLSLDTDADIDHVCGLIDGLPTIVEANNGTDN